MLCGRVARGGAVGRRWRSFPVPWGEALPAAARLAGLLAPSGARGGQTPADSRPAHATGLTDDGAPVGRDASFCVSSAGMVRKLPTPSVPPR